MLLRVAGCVLACLLCVPVARAEWVEASSDHFVIYGDSNPKKIRSFAERLELFHAAMAELFVNKLRKPSPSNRLTVLLVPETDDVQDVAHLSSRFVAGVYLPRAGAAVAVVPKRGTGSDYGLSAETILFHEYAHHFMYSLTRRAYPRWFVEGFAEFYSNVRFTPSSVGLGAPAFYRELELAYGHEIPMHLMLDYDGGVGKDAKQSYEAFYGQSWLLFHYLEFAPERAGQMSRYQQLLGTGSSALEAAEGAFGDLEQLGRDVQHYGHSKQLKYWKLNRADLATGPIAVRPLSRGEAEMMPLQVRARAGVTPEEAPTLVPEARRIAVKYPAEPAVQVALAQAEVDAGNDDAAIAAADRAIAIDPQLVNAYLQKARALTNKLHDGTLSKEAWREVRTQYIKANKLENDHPIPLIGFYTAFREQGLAPTSNAVAGLEWALSVAPFDPELRWKVALQMLDDDRLAEAANTLAPLAYNPHPGESTDRARELLKQVESRMKAGEAQTSAH